MARVYLETSFFSACVSDRTDPKSLARKIDSRRWWVHQGPLHELLVSSEVIRELSAPTYPRRTAALALTSETQVLVINDDVIGLARILVREKVMPAPDQAGDAIHIAAATVHGAEVVLTWNVRHLANRNKVIHLREVCRRIGYVPPEITTPDVYWQSVEELE